MSGGSFNYLCDHCESDEIFDYLDELKHMAKVLEAISPNSKAAKDTNDLLDYIYKCKKKIDKKAKPLYDVFHVMEWYYSSDYGKEAVIEEIEKYENA